MQRVLHRSGFSPGAANGVLDLIVRALLTVATQDEESLSGGFMQMAVERRRQWYPQVRWSRIIGQAVKVYSTG